MMFSIGFAYFILMSFCFPHVGTQISASSGQTVVLPCSLKPQPDATLIWKDRRNKNVLKVKGGEVVEKAHNRVDTFLDKHSTGNFSIRISDVNVNDSGRYECHLQTARKYVVLDVTEGNTGKMDEVLEEDKVEPEAKPRGGAVVLQLSAFASALVLGLLLP